MLSNLLTECCVHRPEEGSTLNVGFCFSFPMDQTAMNRGKLIKWTKGFTNSGAEGSDASLLLEEALSRQGTKVQHFYMASVSTVEQCRQLYKSGACEHHAKDSIDTLPFKTCVAQAKTVHALHVSALASTMPHPADIVSMCIAFSWSCTASADKGTCIP